MSEETSVGVSSRSAKRAGSLLSDNSHHVLTRQHTSEDDVFFNLVGEVRDYAIFRLDQDGCVASWNVGAESIFGVKASEIIGKHFSGFYPKSDIALGKLEQELKLVLAAGQCEDEGWRVRQNGSRFWASSTITVLRDEQGQLLGFSVITHDLTERRQIEEELCQVNRSLRTLSDCNQALVRATEESELLRDICRIIVEVGGYSTAGVGFPVHHEQENDLQSLALAGYAVSQGLYLQSEDQKNGHNSLFGLYSVMVMQTGRPYVVENIFTEPNFSPWCSFAQERGYASLIVLPLIAKHLDQEIAPAKPFGVLSIYAAMPNTFDAEKVKLLGELADDLAYGIMALRTRQERSRAESALRESEELHRITLSNISDAVFITDNLGFFTYICPNVHRTFGYYLQQVQEFGKISRLLGERIFEVLSELEPAGEIQNLEWEIEDQTGKQHILLINIKRVAIKGGTILYTCRDITQRRQTAAALRESEERYRQLIEISPEAIAVQAEDKIVLINPAGAKLFGANNPEDLISKSLQELGHFNGQKPSFLTEKSQEVPFIEQKVFRPDGTILDLEVASLPFIYQRKPAMLMVARDVTERKRVEWELKKYRHHLEELVAERTAKLMAANEQLQQEICDRKFAEEALRHSEEQLRTLINATPDIVCFKDGAGKWLEANAAMLQIFQLEHIDYRGKTDQELGEMNIFGREAFRNCQRTDELAWSKQTLSGVEEIINNQEGVARIFEVIKVPLFYPDGKRKGIVVLGRDITARKQAEAALERLSRQNKLILNSAGEGICGLDLCGKITFVNPDWSENAGC